MKNIYLLYMLTCLNLMSACDEVRSDLDLSVGNNVSENEALVKETSSQSTTEISLVTDQETFTINDINEEKSYLQFYTSESQINQDGNFFITSASGEQSLTVVVDGLNAKGKEEISGKVNLEENQSLILFKVGETEIRFTSGELTIHAMQKSTGKVKIEASGLCNMKVGKSYSNMKMDVPATLKAESQIKDVKTLNFNR